MTINLNNKQNLDKIRNGEKVILSNSMVKAFKTCERQFVYNYVLSKEKDSDYISPKYFAFGIFNYIVVVVLDFVFVASCNFTPVRVKKKAAVNKRIFSIPFLLHPYSILLNSSTPFPSPSCPSSMHMMLNFHPSRKMSIKISMN